MKITNYTDLPHSELIQDLMGEIETEFNYHKYQKENKIIDCCIDSVTGKPMPRNRKVEWQDVWHLTHKDQEIHAKTFKSIPAYTLSEILSVLPKEIKIKAAVNDETYYFGRTITNSWIGYKPYCGLFQVEGKKMYNNINDLPNAASELLRWCGENGHIKGGE
jgi:hypothetical protein